MSPIITEIPPPSGGGGSQTLAQTLALGANANSIQITNGHAATAATSIPIFSQIPTLLSPTAVQTGDFTAAAGNLVPCDISAGSFTVTLPTAPADQTQVCVEVVARVTTGAPFYVTVACGGSDVLFIASGATSGIMGSGSVVFQYNASGAIWYAPGTGDLLPSGWQFGYDIYTTGNVNITGTTSGSPTTFLTCAAHVFDGAPVRSLLYLTSMITPSGVAATLQAGIFESGSLIQATTYNIGNNVNGIGFGGTLGWQLTPSAGSHTYTFAGWVSTGSGIVAQAISAEFMKV
jgi:hypothetical protein